MPDVRLMLRNGYPGRHRRDHNGSEVPLGDCTAELWRVLTGDEPPADNLTLALNMVCCKGHDPNNLRITARQCFGVLVGAHGHAIAGDVIAAVDSGPAALYLLDVWHIAGEGFAETDYQFMRRLVTKGEPLIAVAFPIRSTAPRLVVPGQ